MDCDQVFMVLTSGPFPTGAKSDLEVEDHLDLCSDCWRIAQALRPAHDVFEEAVPASEGRDLPGYWGDATPARAALAQVQQTALRTTALRRRPHRAPVIRYVPVRSHTALGAWDVARIASFVVLIGSAAFAAAWFLQ